jgi:two-component system nitrogen regulation sensor histidine kinase GlnL
MQIEPNTIIDGLYTAVLVTDPQLRIAYANPAAEQLLSMSLSRLKSLRFGDLVDRTEKAFLSNIPVPVKASFQGFSATGIMLSPEPGFSVEVDVNVDPYNGRAHGLIVELRTPAHRQRLVNAVQMQTQHMAARDLIRNLAHEIKNPLGGIRGAAQLLEMTFGAQKGLKEYTSVIIEQTDRLKSLVDSLLGPQRPNPTVWVNIHFVIEKVLSLMAMSMQKQLPLRIEKDYDPSLPELKLDVDAMQQVLINIVKNATDAMSAAGTEHPLLRIRTRAESGVMINNHRCPTAVVLSVTNNGPEIPEELRQTIFYPMVTTKRTGNGLGLPIAQGIMERHGGTLDCRSDEHETTFRLILPLPKSQDLKEV